MKEKLSLRRPLSFALLVGILSSLLVGLAAFIVIGAVGDGESPIFKTYANGVLALLGCTAAASIFLLATMLRSNILAKETNSLLKELVESLSKRR